MIPVTKPFLPPFDEYQTYLKGIWERQWLTNNGPLVNELELKLKEYLNVPHLLYVTNGTIALQIAIKALNLKGKIITTPFSYVATTSSIVWEQCVPVFVDIDPDTLNIDAAKIEKAISPDTTAILATHVYGNACNIDGIQSIAEKYNLKVIYDAAHCFGTKYKGTSIFNYGDISTTSFHATKLFHTVEGGALFTQDAELLKRMAFMRNFGHNGPEKFSGVGINGKGSEFHAAMGLLNLKYIDSILERRKQLSIHYIEQLKNLRYTRPLISKNTQFNFAYFPVLMESEEILIECVKELEKNWISPRRYFYPSLASLDYVNNTGELCVTEDAVKKILCLPLYDTLSTEEINFVCRILLRVQNN